MGTHEELLLSSIEEALDIEGAVVLNWVVVAEYMKPEDETPSIFFDTGDMTSLATQKGLLHEALYGDPREWEDEED